MSLKDTLNKEITLDGFKELASVQLGKDNRYPSKRSINLVFDEENSAAKRRKRLITIIIIALIVLFAKFMVFDIIRTAIETQHSYETMSAAISRLAKTNSGYAALDKQDVTYGNGALDTTEKQERDRIEMLGIINENVTPTSTITGVTITGNTAEVTLNSSQLSNVSGIVASLQGNSAVKYCDVSTATRDNSPVTTVLTIQFRNAGSK